MKKLLLLFAISYLPFAISSCVTSGCEETRESYCLAELSSQSGAQINQLYAYGIGQGKGETDSTGVVNDAVMLSANSPKNLEFILNPDSTITDIRLQMTVSIDGEQSQFDDTLHFFYDPNPYLIDLECGCSVIFNLKEVSTTTHFLKGISIKHNEISNAENINLIIEY